jgi:heat shock protein HslJ
MRTPEPRSQAPLQPTARGAAGHPRAVSRRATAGPAAVAVAVLFTLLGACGPGASGTPTPPPSSPGAGGSTAPAGLDGRTFLSTRVVVDGRERGLVPGTRIRIEFQAGRIGVSAGCNRMGADYRLEGDVLRIANAAVTEMGCHPARHDQDEWLFDLLGRGPSVTLAGETLTIAQGTTTITLLDREVAEPDLPLVGTDWVLVSILSADVASSVPAGVVARLRFEADGRVSVETGCNSGGGAYRVEGERIVFGDLALTKRACVGPAGEVEATILNVLAAREVVFGIDGATLRLVAGSVGLDFQGAASAD